MLTVTRVHHAWPEADGTILDRPYGVADEYMLIHYWNLLRLRMPDGSIQLTKPYAFQILPPDTPQWYQVEKKLTHDFIHIKGDVVARLKQYGLECHTVYYPNIGSEITDMVRGIENEYISQKLHSDRAMDTKLEMLFISVVRALSNDPSKTVVQVDKEIEKALRALRLRVMRTPELQWTAAKMAAEVALSSSWFYTLYRSVFGITPNRDLILCRVEKAREWLENTDLPLEDVAAHCGYTEITHFIRQFRDVVGETPKQYRLKNRKR